MIYPPFYATVRLDAGVQSVFGTDPRIYPHGAAPQKETRPYAVFQTISGQPENYLGQLPDADSHTVQADVYAADVGDASTGAAALIAALESQAYVTSYRGQFKDPDTSLYRFSFDVDFITPR